MILDLALSVAILYPPRKKTKRLALKHSILKKLVSTRPEAGKRLFRSFLTRRLDDRQTTNRHHYGELLKGESSNSNSPTKGSIGNAEIVIKSAPRAL